MKVKIGNTWFDSNEQPICIQVSELEQKQIGNLDRTIAIHGKYAIFPDEVEMSDGEMIEWMKK